MNIRFVFLFLMLLVTSVGAQENKISGAIKSTLTDQESVEVTVYNSNIALVKDTRVISLPVRQAGLPQGEGELRFMDVAALIMPVTVHIKSLNHADEFSVLEQNYEYDLISPQKLMDKYVGKKVKLLDYNPYQDKKEIVEATLLSNNNGEVYKINDEIHVGHPGYKILPEMPENLISQPTLTWMFSNFSNTPHRLEVSYLTSSLNWKADYVLALDKDDRLADLSGWVTLDNKSGATYKDAKLKLVAGEVNRAEPIYEAYGLDQVSENRMGKAGSQFVEQSFFEYHIYDLQRRTTIKDNQIKQVSLLEANDVNVQKEFLVKGNQGYWFSVYPKDNNKIPVEVFLRFKNSEENNMGMPLPQGIIRLYKADQAGSLQFIGEDRIEHTPKNEEVKLKIGKAFDLIAERVQTDYQLLSNAVYESAWEITLRNHKSEDVMISLLEPLTSDWQVLSSSLPFKKVDAFTIRFDVPVPKDQEVKVQYRVRVRYK